MYAVSMRSAYRKSDKAGGKLHMSLMNLHVQAVWKNKRKCKEMLRGIALVELHYYKAAC